MISGIVQTSLFITQWTAILSALWVSCVIIPFTIMGIVFAVLDWLILDQFTNFLTTGKWDNANVLAISPTSPIAIMTYVGVVFGIIFFAIFFLNYFARNFASGFEGREVFKRLYYSLGFIIFILVIPFAAIAFMLVMRVLTNLINSVMNTSLNAQNLLNLNSLSSSVAKLLTFTAPSLISSETWSQIWNSIDTSTNTDLVNLKDQIFNQYNNLVNSFDNYNFYSLLRELNSIGISNLSGLKSFFNQENLITNWQSLSSSIDNLRTLLNNLESSGSISAAQLTSIRSVLGSFSSYSDLSTFNENLNLIITKGLTLSNINLDSNNELITTSNLGYLLYFNVTGNYVNSLEGIWANWFGLSYVVSTLFNSGSISSNFIQVILVFTLSTAIAVGSAKGIGSLIFILIYRWYAILAMIPFGIWATARSVNDDGALFKIWIREWITVFVSLFVVAFNFAIMKLIINIYITANDNGNILISGINNNAFSGLFMRILFCMLAVTLIYCTSSFTTNILEKFTQSSIAKDFASDAIVNEYRRAKSSKKSTSSNMRKSTNSFKKSAKGWETKAKKSFDKLTSKDSSTSSTPKTTISSKSTRKGTKK